MKYLILDLDGTISAAGERNIFFVTEPRNFPAAEAGTIYDDVIEQTKIVVDLFHNSGYEVVVLTARSDSCHDNCVTWLTQNKIPFKDIFMRPSGNYTPDYVIKEKLLDDIVQKYGKLPEFALEDKSDVIQMFNRKGVFCFGIFRPF